MSDDDYDDYHGYEQEITRLLPFFYPSSQSTTPNPTSAAANLVNHLKTVPLAPAALATDLPNFLLYIAEVHPAHIDHVLQAVQILINTPSLPLINNWDSSRPNATFEEMFHVALRDDVNDSIRGDLEVAERKSHLAASLLAARARYFGLLNTPATMGSLAEGLGFPDDIRCHYQGGAAEIAAIGSCIQLLCGVSWLVQKLPVRFAKDKILAALDGLGLQFSRIDALIKVCFIVWNLRFAIFMAANIVHQVAFGKGDPRRFDQRGVC